MFSSNRTRPAAAMTLCVPKTSSESCDQAIFVDQGTCGVSQVRLVCELQRWARTSRRAW